MIPEVPVDSTPAPKKIVHEYKEPIPEPFEKRRINEVRAAESRSVYGQSVTSTVKNYSATEPAAKAPETSTAYEPAHVVTGTQQTLGDYDKVFLQKAPRSSFPS